MKNLLMLHGALGTETIFNPIKSMLDNHFKIHTLNFSGHGINSDHDYELTSDVFCNDVIRCMEVHHLETVSIFGYSMGGYVALNLAMLHPEKVDKIFTLGTVFDWSPERAVKEAGMLNSETIELKVPAFAKSLENLHGKDNWRKLTKKTAHFMIRLGDHHLTEHDFNLVKCPVRISVGDRDKMVSIESSLQVSKELPNGSMLVIPDTPHPFEKVDTARLVYEINDFFLK